MGTAPSAKGGPVSIRLGKRRATQADVARADQEFARRFADAAKLFLEDDYEEAH